jgi:multicomponent Na+:H+ antiporter subunit E
MDTSEPRFSRWERLRRTPPSVPVLLLALWVFLSGKLDAFHLGTGVVGVLGILWLHAGLPATGEERAPGLRVLRLATYFPWLAWQMILSAVFVARVILSPRRLLDPQLIEFQSEQPSRLSRVILANSITLTPGTITLDLTDERFVVHALTRSTAEDTLGGEMARRVAKLSVDTPVPPPRRLATGSGGDSQANPAAESRRER